jgi:hypothetical protein
MRCAKPVADAQFQEAVLGSSLKLQSSVEVFEWVPTRNASLSGKERQSSRRFRCEWSTVHHKSREFKKPCPENPRPPRGIALGTATKTCGMVELGGYVIGERGLGSLQHFQPAAHLLPDRLTAHGILFFANRQDGYYYARPGHAADSPEPGFGEPKVGDMRAHFMHVPEGPGTVVAVQCEKDGKVSFVPYRPIARLPCTTDFQERMRLVEEGGRSLGEMKREASCCAGGAASFCCCACNAIGSCCKAEAVTEEIFYTSDRLESAQKAFQQVVQRSPCRVWNFRLVGWGVMLLGFEMALGPVAGPMPALWPPALGTGLGVSVLATLSTTTFVMSAAHAPYRPLVAVQWCFVAVALVAAPLIWGRLAG